MRPFSIRVRLTAWYVVVLALATTTVGTGSWWLFRQNATTAADASLVDRLHNVADFIQSLKHEPSPVEVQDEFREFGELTAGESLLEVVDPSGTIMCDPSMQGWSDLRIPGANTTAPRFEVRFAAGRPFRVVAATLVVDSHAYQVTAAIPMGPTYAALDRFGWSLALLLPLVVLLAAGGGWLISRRALAPVDQMTRAVQAISLRNLDRRLDVPQADDELQRLAVTFNDMLKRLQTSVADMVRFTAEASHELKTPVSIVRATAEVTLSRERTGAEYRHALADVLEQSERMSVLVNDLLALARVDAGVEPSDTATVDLSAVANEVSREVQTSMNQKTLDYSASLAAEANTRGSAESFRRLMLILLDNAIKYTPEGGRVWLRVATSSVNGDGACIVEVSDTGAGIDPSERSRVFDRFYRGAAARQQADGSGLGLSIARAIVERHGGTIAVEPRPDGQGTRVTARVPHVAT